MTHKNPELRSSSIVPENQKKEPPVVGKKPAVLAKKPAKFELEDGNKWMVVSSCRSPE
jgi:adenylyl cyclase-associated protein